MFFVKFLICQFKFKTTDMCSGSIFKLVSNVCSYQLISVFLYSFGSNSFQFTLYFKYGVNSIFYFRAFLLQESFCSGNFLPGPVPMVFFKLSDSNAVLTLCGISFYTCCLTALDLFEPVRYIGLLSESGWRSCSDIQTTRARG